MLFRSSRPFWYAAHPNGLDGRHGKRRCTASGNLVPASAVIHRDHRAVAKGETIAGHVLDVRKPPDACNAEGLLTHPLDDTEKEG